VVKALSASFASAKLLSSSPNLQTKTSNEVNKQDQDDYRRTLIMLNSMSMLS
jgi:hypothetical protein